MAAIGSSFAGDREEDIIRTKIDQLEVEASRLAEENFKINSHCTEEMGKLSNVKKEERMIVQQAKSLDYQIMANLKLRSRKDDAIRAYTQRINRLEEKRRNVSLQLERRTFPKREEESALLAKSVTRAMEYEKKREKQRLLKDAVNDDIKFAKKQLYLEAKRMKADMAKRIFDRERAIIEENRKRHLEVLYQERMYVISKETNMNQRIKKTYKRLNQEVDIKSKNVDFFAKKIETLEKVNDHQRVYLEDQREKEFELLQRYRQMLCPVEARIIENNRNSTSGFKGHSHRDHRDRSRETSKIEQALEEPSAATFSRHKKSQESTGKPISRKYSERKSDLVLMTTVDIDKARPSNIVVTEGLNLPSEHLQLDKVVEENSKEHANNEASEEVMQITRNILQFAQSLIKPDDAEKPAVMTTSSGSRPFPKASNHQQATDEAGINTLQTETGKSNEINKTNISKNHSGGSFDFEFEKSKPSEENKIEIDPQIISIIATKLENPGEVPKASPGGSGLSKPNFKFSHS